MVTPHPPHGHAAPAHLTPPPAPSPTAAPQPRRRAALTATAGRTGFTATSAPAGPLTTAGGTGLTTATGRRLDRHPRRGFKLSADVPAANVIHY